MDKEQGSSEKMKAMEQQLFEFECANTILEAFIIEKGLHEELFNFSNQVVSDFKRQHPNLTLVK